MEVDMDHELWKDSYMFNMMSVMYKLELGGFIVTNLA